MQWTESPVSSSRSPPVSVWLQCLFLSQLRYTHPKNKTLSLKFGYKSKDVMNLWFRGMRLCWENKQENWHIEKCYIFEIKLFQLSFWLNMFNIFFFWTQWSLCHYNDSHTSMSSLFGSSGASMRFLRRKLSASTSNVCPVICDSLSQCLGIIALLAIISSRGQVSLKSSIVFFNSSYACHSFNALGNFRHLWCNFINLN